jgi:hypothetical protein
MPVGVIFIADADSSSTPGNGLRKPKKTWRFWQPARRRKLWLSVSVTGVIFLIAGLSLFKDGLSSTGSPFGLMPGAKSTPTTALPGIEEPNTTVSRFETIPPAVVQFETSPTITPSPTYSPSPPVLRTSHPTRTPSPVPLPTPLGGGFSQLLLPLNGMVFQKYLL